MRKKNLSDIKLKNILNDKTSGSSEILIELHNHLKNQAKLIHLFPEIIELTKNQFQSFQNVQHYLNEMNTFLKREKKLNGFFERYDDIFENSKNRLVTNAVHILSKYSSYITISNSKTVFDVFSELNKQKKKLKVIVSESRPKLEGRILAKKLSALNHVKVFLITEAMMANALNKSEVAIIGADSVLSNGNVVNKVGSLQLALLCNKSNIPFYVVADKNKFRRSSSFSQNEMPPEEIWRHYPKNITIKNNYFEIVNRELITQIITD